MRKLALTSSIAAIRSQRPENWPADNTFDETFWSDVTDPNISTYNKSKTLAEKCAWDFREALPEAERFDIISLNPALIFGPAN